MSIVPVIVRAAKNPQRAIRRLGDKLLTFAGHRSFRPFIILSRSRTGSNLLVSLLNSHPNIRADGEILAKLDGRRVSDVLAEAYSRQPWFVKAKGFKIFYYHPMDDDSGRVWQSLDAIDGLLVIHLKRRNILHTLVSRKVAGLNDAWTKTNANNGAAPGEPAHQQVAFTAAELREGFRQTRDWENQGDQGFEKHRKLTVMYEDLVNDRDATMRRITEFLGIAYAPPSTTLLKQNTKPMREVVAEYDELKAEFAGTEWSGYFDE